MIDGDNAQAALIGQVLTETAKYGIVTTRRIYGDWTTPEMSKWKETLNAHAVQPVQQFRYTTGKNATDSTLIIEAMDLLHSGTVNGFCIVSSDSDYTRLATRIREQGLFVMGIGQATTPKSLVNACEVFVYTKNLIPPEKPKARVQRAAAGGGAPDDEERPDNGGRRRRLGPDYCPSDGDGGAGRRLGFPGNGRPARAPTRPRLRLSDVRL